MVTLLSLKGKKPAESPVAPPRKRGVFLDQSMPLPLAVSTPDSINFTAILTFAIGLSN